METLAGWYSRIQGACEDSEAARSNRRITDLHYSLSEALADALGREGGPNFHSWAVWGSRKAGATIRQEDLSDAVTNATVTAGIVGSLLGFTLGVFLGRKLRWNSDLRNGMLGAGLGSVTGACTGRELAVTSRREAARLVLEGNRTVLIDIGVQSARFLELLHQGATEKGRESFFAGLRPGTSETRGQARLAKAFRSYLEAFDSNDLQNKRAAMIAGNCEIVYHEHIRLEPYIRRAMPWIVQRCATERLMTYEVGNRVLTVGEDVPGTPASAAHNWTNIEERMRYVFALFRKFHDDPAVFAAPYATCTCSC